MSTWNVILTDEAQKDIRGIYDYIANTYLLSDVAAKQAKRILDTIHSLEFMPLRYQLYEKEPWHSRGLRSARVNNYLIFYIPVEEVNEVVIFHVFYAGRDIQKLLDELL